MCYDQENTQAPMDSFRAEKQMYDRIRERLSDSHRAANACPGGQLGYSPRMSDAAIVDQLFRYQPPTPETLPKFAAINQAGKNFAEVILQNCPPGMDRSAAIRLIRDARMTANASIALNGLSL